jgi:hypothetical protein
MTTSKKVAYRLSDSLGHILASGNLSKGEWDINLPESSGIYLLTILPYEGRQVTYKIVVK